MRSRTKTGPWAEISLANLQRNFHLLRAQVPAGTRISPVVKGNAYGHGMLQIAHALEHMGANGLCVATVDEGVQLRRFGITIPIYVLGAVLPEAAEIIVDYHLTAAVTSVDFALALNQAASVRKTKVPVHMRIDVGLGSLGFPERQFLMGLHRVSRFPWIHIEGMFTQLAAAYSGNLDRLRNELNGFQSAYEEAVQAGYYFDIVHAASSPALVSGLPVHYDMVRPGILMYGLPLGIQNLNTFPGLRTVMQIKAQITEIQRHKQGTRVGYRSNIVLPEDRILASIDFGYADGMFMHSLHEGQVLVNGVRTPVLGHAYMDHAVIDITDVGQASIGDEVVLLGRQGCGEITASELATRAGVGLDNADCLCLLSERVERVYDLLPRAMQEGAL